MGEDEVQMVNWIVVNCDAVRQKRYAIGVQDKKNWGKIQVGKKKVRDGEAQVKTEGKVTKRGQ